MVGVSVTFRSSSKSEWLAASVVDYIYLAHGGRWNSEDLSRRQSCVLLPTMSLHLRDEGSRSSSEAAVMTAQ